MADSNTTTSAPAPPKRHGFLKFLAWFVGILIVLLVAIYFIATSSAFLNGVILPQAGKALNSDITVSAASIHPFKEIELKNLKLTPHGQQTLVTAPEVRVRYNLMRIIGGNIDVDEITLASAKVTRVENADGSSNLDPIESAQNKTPKKEEKKPSKPTQLDLKKFALTDATIQNIKNYTNGNRDVTELSHVNITADNLKNNSTGKLALDADLKMESNPPDGTNGTLAAKIKGAFDLALSSDLKPTSIKGNTHVQVGSATGALAQAAGLGTDLDCDVSPTEIKQLALRFSKGDNRLGELRAFGPFDMEKTEGKITVQLLSLDKQVLNLAGASSGMDFGSTTVNSTNQIELAKGGSVITAAGDLSVNKLRVTRDKETTPTLDLLAKYNATIDRNASNATLRELTLNGLENGRQMLKGELTSPMSLSWGKSEMQAGDSTLNIAITDLNLRDWRAFLGKQVSSGKVNSKITLLSQQGGKLLTFDVGAQIDNLTASAGSNRISQAGVTLVLKGRANDLEKFDLSEYSAKVAHQNQVVLTVGGAGTYDKAAGSADLQLAVNSALPRLLEVFPQPDIAFSSGTLDLKGRLVQQKDTMALTGNLAVNNLTGKSGKDVFQNYQTAMDLDVAKTADQIQIRRVNGKVSEGGQAGGAFDVTGTVKTNNAMQITAKLSDFNQNGLRPFLEPLLSGKQLVSVALNGSANLQYDPNGDSSVKGDFKVANLVVKDPTNPAPATPLEAGLNLDASLQKQVADIRTCTLTLSPTDRAKNQLQIAGKVDMSNTNAYQGNLKVSSDALDVTRYYDLFAGPAETNKAAANPAQAPRRNGPPTASTASSSSGPEKEPDAIKLPVKSFTADVNIGRLYLREVEITNWQTTARIEGSHIVMNPCKLALNGAPVDADVDLDVGVPGYKYDTSFSMKAVPIPPLVNSFEPDRKGQIGGTLTAQAKVTGAGITGSSLKKNLNGNFDINSTNLNYAIDKVKEPVIKVIVNVVGSVPELIHNPIQTAGTLFGGLVGLQHGGLSDELQKSPIQAINAKGTAGSGEIKLQQASVISAAFRADANGTVQIADVLTNSPINLPVSISLSRDVAQRFGIGGDTNAAYSKFPDFLLIGGTVGDPKPDKKKLLVLGTSAVGGVIKSLTGNEGVGNLIQGAGGLLGGNKSSSSGSTGTNQPTGRSGLLNDVTGLLGGNKSSRSGSTNQPTTNKSNAGDLLNEFLKPRK